ncbi:MAG: HEAT repeat domain-containing protein [Pirellulales bacterium]|nr:HEAT repeat domain-containing protein [Pirellulales bacterium]
MSRRVIFAGMILFTVSSSLMMATWGLTGRSAASSQQRSTTVKSDSGEAQWIWSAGSRLGATSPGTRYFRRVFGLRRPVEGTIEISCQDAYELYVNGRFVGKGHNWQSLDQYDIASELIDGRNTIAVKTSSASQTAGLVARVVVRGAGGPYVAFSTDESWMSSTTADAQWAWPNYDSSSWQPAVAFGEFGRTAPWNNRVRAADGGSGERFTLPPGFQVDRVAAPDDTGSLTAITFDENGHIIAAQEGGPLIRLYDEDGDGVPESMMEITTEINNCQGVLSVNGVVYATGEGKDGTGVYRLTDSNGDGVADDVKRLMAFSERMGEHGAHALQFGPDGWIYVMIGNHSQLADRISQESPYQNFYEGDLVQPRHEDAGGHAVGIKAPGGVIVRMSLDGQTKELFAGGFRNPYDFAFDPGGELFTYESDMEWDEGLPWYRPTRVLHVPAGGEFGWRSGWAKWPEYYLDSLPSIVETGRGSPTGVDFYDHDHFPSEYKGALFGCDWTRGRIVVVKMKREGATFSGEAETFIEGRPLNVTDIAVGPTGALYFSTGGRGTEGGIYRITSSNRSTDNQQSTGIYRALRQPQFYSAFAREAIALIQQEMGEDWNKQLPEVAFDNSASTGDRVRAIEFMYLYGPRPGRDGLITLTEDSIPQVRAAAVRLLGLLDVADVDSRLGELLVDDEAVVRAAACEALRRRKSADVPIDSVISLLADADRYVAAAAHRLLQTNPVANWREQVLKTEIPAVFNHGAVALLTTAPSKETALAVVESAQRVLQGFVNDKDFVELLRVLQLALLHGQLQATDVPQLIAVLDQEYPAYTNTNPVGGRRMNRELVRLLAHLEVSSAIDRMLEQTESEEPIEERLHVAAYASTIRQGWTSEQKVKLIAFFEKARDLEGGYSLSRYVENFAMDFGSSFSEVEQALILENALAMPTAALGVLAKLPEQPDATTLALLRRVDRQLDQLDSTPARRLQTGIVAVFGRAADAQSMQYLRGTFERSPERRMTVAMGLAQNPSRQNWPYLMRALPTLEGPAAVEVLTKILESNQKPDRPESARQVVILGLKLGSSGATTAVKVLEKWFQRQLPASDAGWQEALPAWQEWFAVNFPDLPPASLPRAMGANRWSYNELLAELTDGELIAHPAAGAVMFSKAQCAKCHRFGSVGDVIGPDLTTVAQRFQKKEVLESIIYPGHVISDQYATRIVLMRDGRQFAGIVGSAGPGAYQILQANGEKIRVAQNDVEEIVTSANSTMPEGLLNNLTMQEIVDLFGYLFADRRDVAQAPSRTRQ